MEDGILSGVLHLRNGKAADVGVSLSKLFLIHISQCTCWIGAACRTILCACMRNMIWWQDQKHHASTKPPVLHCIMQIILSRMLSACSLRSIRPRHLSLTRLARLAQAKHQWACGTTSCHMAAILQCRGVAPTPDIATSMQIKYVPATSALGRHLSSLCSHPWPIFSIALAWYSDQHQQLLTLGVDSSVGELPG